MKYNMHTARKGYRCIPIQLRTQCIRILSHQKSLMTENDRDLNDRIHEYMNPYTPWGSLLVMSKLPKFV